MKSIVKIFLDENGEERVSIPLRYFENLMSKLLDNKLTQEKDKNARKNKCRNRPRN